jgi:hypothetical protein
MSDFQTSDPESPPLMRRISASEQLREVSFPLAVRGYERTAVDDFVNAVRSLVAELEANQTRESAVQKALDDVGLETASILRRAHHTADEITARSQADADERLRQAENDAARARREADAYSEQVVVDTRLLWDERQRLIDDARQLADDVLAMADDAMDRVKMPEPIARPTDPAPETTEEPVTGPVEVAPAGVPGIGEVEAEPPGDETGAHAPVERTDPYELEDDALIGDPAPAPPPQHVPSSPESPQDDAGHTVELEALPGGADPEESGRIRRWDRGRD